MNLDSIIRGFYASLLIGAIAVCIWGFATVMGIIPTTTGNSIRYALLAFWGASFVFCSIRYEVIGKDKDEE